MMSVLKSVFIPVLLSGLFASCTANDNPRLDKIDVRWSDGIIRKAADPADLSVKVFLFMSPECPLCINYTGTINNLKYIYHPKGVNFYLVYPGTWYTQNEIEKFESEYNLEVMSLYDSRNEIARALKATITPQAIVLNPAGEIVYSGAIDNRAFAPGKKRQVITQHYLENAIGSILKGEQPNPHLTEAIGCFIEY